MPSATPTPTTFTTCTSTTSAANRRKAPSTTSAPTTTTTATTQPFNLGPLTTTWTPPPNCVNLVGARGLLDRGWQGQLCGKRGPTDDGVCWPPTTSGAVAVRSDPPFAGRGFYSPGLVCPSGYVAACTSTAGSSAPFQFQFALEAGETGVGCCPSGYICDKTRLTRQTCQMLITTPTSILIGTCPTAGSDLNYMYRTIPLTTTTDANSTMTLVTIATFTANAPMFQLNHRAEDVITTPTIRTTSTAPPIPAASVTSTIINTNTAPSSTSPVSINAAASSTSATTPTGAAPTDTSNALPKPMTNSPPPAEPDSSPRPSMTAGTKAGIGVGAGAAVLIISVIAYFLWRSKRRRRDSGSSSFFSPSFSFFPPSVKERKISAPMQQPSPTEIISSPSLWTPPRPPRPSVVPAGAIQNPGLVYSPAHAATPFQQPWQFQGPYTTNQVYPAPLQLNHLRQQYHAAYGQAVPLSYTDPSGTSLGNETWKSDSSSLYRQYEYDHHFDETGRPAVREVNPHQPAELI